MKTSACDITTLTFAEVLVGIKNELQEVARRETNSVLRQKDFESMSNLQFEDIINEMNRLCPFTYHALSVMIDEHYNREKKIAPLALIYSIIMFRRCHELSRLQRVNTMLLTECGAGTEVNNCNLYNITTLISFILYTVVGTFYTDCRNVILNKNPRKIWSSV